MPKPTQRPSDKGTSCCQVESVISVDDRGQMVLPKEIRQKMHLKAGDKLALVTWEKDEKVCCVSLIPVDQLTDMVKVVLGPFAKEIF